MKGRYQYLLIIHFDNFDNLFFVNILLHGDVQNLDILQVFVIPTCLGIFNRSDDISPPDTTSKDCMLIVKPGCWNSGDEKL